MDLVLIASILAQVGAFVAGTWLAGRLIGSIVGRALSHGSSLAANRVKRLTEVSVWLSGLTLAAEYFGLRTDVLLVLLALSGAAILIAIKDALQNLAARYFSDVYMQFRIGDSIKVREFAGKVIELNPVTTMLATDNDEVVAIPNTLLIREVVVNTTPYAGRDVTIPIVIYNDRDLPAFEKQVLLSCNKLRVHLDERLPPMISVKQRNDKSTELQLSLRVKLPEKKELVMRQLNSRIKVLLEKKSGEHPVSPPKQQNVEVKA